MKGFKKSFGVIFLAGFFVFQNCSPFESAVGDSLYAYSTKPIFFSDLKLINREQQSDRVVYIFDFVISNAADPRANLEYSVSFFDGDDALICPVNSGTVNNSNNHVRINCSSPIIQQSIRTSVSARLPDQDAEVREFNF